MPRIIISGGGTGGHIFPAIAIANAVKKQNHDTEILFVGAMGRMEMEKVPAAGYRIEGLWISGLQRSLTVKNALFPVKVMRSVSKSIGIIRRFKPDAVVGVGGYASGPLLYAASLMKIPALIQEQNSFPGITNRMLAKRVQRICVAYDGMEKWFPKEKILLTGNPVRQELIHLEGKKARASEAFELNPDRPTLLVVGGSLGARTINESIANCLELLKSKNCQLIWQTGATYAGTAAKLVEEQQYSGFRSMAFIERMDLAYAMADVVISRAGAMSVSELCLVKKPAILVPSPNVAEDHQTKNAAALANANAAILVKDIESREKLCEKVDQLLLDNEIQKNLSSNIGKLAFENAADAIASEVLRLARKQ